MITVLKVSLFRLNVSIDPMFFLGKAFSCSACTFLRFSKSSAKRGSVLLSPVFSRAYKEVNDHNLFGEPKNDINYTINTEQ